MAKTSLKRKLTISIILMISFFGTLAIFSVFFYSKKTLIDNEKRNLQLIVFEHGNQIGQLFKQSELTGKAIAEEKNVIDYVKNKGDHQDEEVLNLLNLFNIGERYSAIYIMNGEGNTMTSTNESFVGKNYGFRDYFKQAKRGFIWTDISIGATSGELGYYISCPIRSGKSVIGVVALKMNPDFINEIVRPATSDEVSNVMIVDEYGVVVFSNKEEWIYKSLGETKEQNLEVIKEKRRFAGMEIKPLQYDLLQELVEQGRGLGQVEFFNKEDGKEKILSISKIRDYPFFLIFEEELDIYKQKAFTTIELLGLIVLITFIISSVVVYLLINNLMRPLLVLKDYVDRASLGVLGERVDIKTGDEIEELGKSFNKMIANMENSRSEIEEKVKDQTEEIIQRQEELEMQQMASLNILEDIEEEKEKVVHEKLKTDSLLESIGEGIIATDQEGQITILNKSAESMLGWTNEEAVGKNVTEIAKMTNEKEEEVDRDNYPVYKALASGKKVYSTLKEMRYYINKEGVKFPVGITVTPLVLESRVIGTVLVFRDITEEAKIDRAKTEFVSLASHQLRTPLSTIKWYAEMLLAGDAGEISDDQRVYLDEIYESNERMVELVNSLLNVSRIELGTFAIEPKKVDVKEIIDSLLKELTPSIEEKKIKISKELDSKIKKIPLDAKLIRMVIQNLLTNAIKYTPEGGLVDISAKKRRKDLLISIKDTGYGIPKKEQSKIFGKMFRAENIKEKDTTGSGLGLYIVKSVIEQSEGRTWFESEEGKGTTFSFTIPLSGMKPKEGTRALT